MTVIYDPSPGVHIDTAIRELVALADKENAPTRMTFNGTKVDAKPGDAASAISAAYHAARAREQAAYDASPVAEAYRAFRKKEGVTKTLATQVSFDAMMAAGAARDMPRMLRAIIPFVTSSDDTEVTFDMRAAANCLRTLGFMANEGVGDPAVENQSDATKVARYIIGQAINFMDSGMPPHGMVGMFAERWLAAQDKPADSHRGSLP